MASVIIWAGGPLPLNTKDQEIWSVGALAKLTLEKNGINSKNIFEILVPDVDQVFRDLILEGLSREALQDIRKRWFELAYQHVFFRFADYFQFQYRLSKILDIASGDVILTSNCDDMLCHAAKVVCERKSRKILIQDHEVYLITFCRPQHLSTFHLEATGWTQFCLW